LSTVLVGGMSILEMVKVTGTRSTACIWNQGLSETYEGALNVSQSCKGTNKRCFISFWWLG